MALDELLHQPNQHIFSLYGLGGIGKSSFVREYLSNHRSEYDAMLYLYANDSLSELLLDDEAVHINTIQKQKEEPVDEYLSRKLKALSRLCAEQNIIVVLDNISSAYIEKASAIFELDWKVLLISRDELPVGFCPSLQISELAVQDMARLFVYYSHCDLDSEERIDAFGSIVPSRTGMRKPPAESPWLMGYRQINSQQYCLYCFSRIPARAASVPPFSSISMRSSFMVGSSLGFNL